MLIAPVTLTTVTGVLLKEFALNALPSPSCPRLFLQKHFTVPSDRRAQACSAPTATATALLMPAICCGKVEPEPGLLPSPKPNQQLTVPSARTAHAPPPPSAPIATAFVMPVTVARGPTTPPHRMLPSVSNAHGVPLSDATATAVVTPTIGPPSHVTVPFAKSAQM